MRFVIDGTSLYFSKLNKRWTRVTVIMKQCASSTQKSN
jgi:hypothetical protein